VGSEKKRSWEVPLLILGVMIAVVVWVGFGERGLMHLYRTEMERQAHLERIQRLAKENQKLLEEIKRLRTDMEYVEAVARKELNLIKENEVVYRFQKKTRGREGGSDPPHDPNNRPKGEVR
jgi:cell division protein FtsB